METPYEILVRDLRHLVEARIQPSYRWYSTNKKWPRVLFRVGGIVVIVGSLTLPVLASSQLSSRDLLLTIVSLAVASFSSLNAFFRWDGAWRSRTRAAYNLQGMLAQWEFKLKAAQYAEIPTTAALEATEVLFKEAFALVGSETDEFFSAVKWPETQKPGGS